MANGTTATPAERMLAAEAGDAVRFVSALLRRYDAVLQNPPFGEPVPETKPYLKAAYSWLPTRNCDLLAAFVGRGLQLCHPGVGYVGAITSRAGMFLTTFEAWRRDVLLGHRLVTLADLGYGVMEDALVEAAAYVIGRSSRQLEPSDGTDRTGSASSTQATTFVRLLKETDRPASLAAAVRADRQGDADPRVFHSVPAELHAIPGSPLAYWISPAIRQLFAKHPPVESNAGDVRVGLQTGDDFRFVRAFWEVDPSRIARSREQTKTGRRWVPFAKGGAYSPYWADIHLVVNYANDGEELRQKDGSVIRSPRYYFRPGLTWPPRTNSGFGIRILPAGVVFGHKGPTITPAVDPCAVLSLLTSRLAQACIDAMVAAGGEVSSGGASRSYEVGLVQNLPWITAIGEDPDISFLASHVARIRRHADLHDEVSRLFLAPPVLSDLLASFGLEKAVARSAAAAGDRHLRILDLTHQLERRVHELAELEEEAEAFLDNEIGPHPTSYVEGPLDEDDLRRLLETRLTRSSTHSSNGEAEREPSLT